MVLLGAIRGFISAEPAPLRGRHDGDEVFQTTSAFYQLRKPLKPEDLPHG